VDVDRSLIKALAGWQWQPAYKHGIPVESTEEAQAPLQ
jgi:hypothetical protein